MFATFSPVNSSKVAYVRNHNIYLEDVNTNMVISFTTDGSNDIINGTFDWVYEEEFQMRNGFRLILFFNSTLLFVNFHFIRWSPDGAHIAFWQINQNDVPVMNLINNTDSLYATLIPIHYPKTGQTNPSARVGVVFIAERSIQWLNIEGDTRNNYIGDN